MAIPNRRGPCQDVKKKLDDLKFNLRCEADNVLACAKP